MELIRICPKLYNNLDDTPTSVLYEFKQYPFELDHFQKYGFESIVRGNHTLITAHTGAGKTLPAEFAIKHFVSQGKRVVYTSPIKSLSNQKFHELSKKFPEISFGLLTGDIKTNPEGDCVIMTAEILRNVLFRKDNDDTNNDKVHFELDLNELGCIIMDEVHYINDEHRGNVWEETIMYTPPHTQLLMLSATIDKADTFAKWVSQTTNKVVWVAGTEKRVVPLTHQVYLTLPDSAYEKRINDKSLEQLCRNYDGSFHTFKTSHSSDFNDNVFNDVEKIKSCIFKNNIRVTPELVMNRVVKKLKKEGKIPAICFVFSRKRAYKMANMITTSLFNSDNPEEATKSSTAEKACRGILMRLPNWKEFINTDEYQSIVSLLEKGIAVHHSGVLPVFREMIELLFSEGYIKLLFATETFAVGVNMPTKTVLFTDMKKFSGGDFRYMLGHEYAQMAGRAGRRGLDKEGFVVHLCNLFETPYKEQYKHILKGTPQTLNSKYIVDVDTVLRILQSYPDGLTIEDVQKFTKTSMRNTEILNELHYIESKKIEIEDNIKLYDIEEINDLRSRVDTYNDLTTKVKRGKNHKKRKQAERELNQFMLQYSNIENNKKRVQDFDSLQISLLEVNTKYELKQRTLDDAVNTTLDMLDNNNVVEKKLDRWYLTDIGRFSAFIQELPSVPTATLINDGIMNELNDIEVISLIACLSDTRLTIEDVCNYDTPIIPGYIEDTLIEFNDAYNKWEDLNATVLGVRNERNIPELVVQKHIYTIIHRWILSQDEVSTKSVFDIWKSYNLLTGDFVKKLLNIVNHCNELTTAFQEHDMDFVSKLSKVEEHLLKDIVTNTSLYV